MYAENIILFSSLKPQFIVSDWRLHQKEFYYLKQMIEERMRRSQRLTLVLVMEFIEQIWRIITIMAGFQSGSYLFVDLLKTMEHTQLLKQTSDNTIQFVYNLGKVKTSEDLKKAREDIIRWFFWKRFPMFRGKRRLGMIQKSSILPSDVK